jgi:hypothetical protein
LSTQYFSVYAFSVLHINIIPPLYLTLLLHVKTKNRFRKYA